jgi:putative membrane protein
MKNKLIPICVAAVGCLSFAGNVSAQNPRPYPPLHSGANADVSATPSAKTNKSTAKAGGNLSAKDKSFMMSAAKGGMMEVEGGKVAAQNAQNADVKKFGNRMVTDHTKANNELMSLAKEEGVSLPGAKSPPKWKSDKDYMDMMVKDHQKDLAEFQAEAQNGTDANLKQFANKTSKVIAKHLQMAQEIDGKLK